MRKVLKWIGIGLGGLVGLVLLAVVGLLIYGQVRWKPVMNRPAQPVAADTSPEGLARGEYLVRNVMGCADCHSADGPDGALAGVADTISAGPVQGLFATANLTPDPQTGLGNAPDAEIVRAIREGIGTDGRALVLMPSANYHHMSDADAAAIVGYLRSLEPVENEIPEMQVNAVGKVLNALGILGPKAVGAPITEPVAQPQPGTPEHGEYMVWLGGCRDCHGQNLTGGTVPFAEEGTPAAPDLTATSLMATWSDEGFLKAMHEGLTPDGRVLNPIMPWRVYGRMSDEDLLAIFQYLRSLNGAEMAASSQP